MARLMLILLGFLGGVIVARNSEHMSNQSSAAVFLTLFVACGIMWRAGYRGKREEVAKAVANATAIAAANAESQARAAATSAINFYLGTQNGVSPEHVASIVDQSVEEIANTRQIPSPRTVNAETELA